MKTTSTCLQPGTADAASPAVLPTGAEHPETGPQPIDPRWLQSIAGGSPKGGWMTVEEQAVESATGEW